MSSDSTRQQLQQAYDLIKANRKSEAQALLMPILKADEDNANAWWLLANALADPAEIREALENVLRLRPGDTKAQKMLNDLAARNPADEFPMEDAGFGGLPTPEMSDWMSGLPEKPKRGRQPVIVKPSGGGGTNPLVIILAIVGVLALIGCAVCFILPAIGFSLFGQQIFEQVMTQAPELQEIFDTITAIPGLGGQPSGRLNQQGNIEYGQTVGGSVNASNDDGWTFQGSQGDQVTIEVNATDDRLDPEVYLLDASDRQVAYDDDGGREGTNSLIVVTLPSTGAYTIRVSAFARDGSYELILRRG
jgi:hypothetical protein